MVVVGVGVSTGTDSSGVAGGVWGRGAVGAEVKRRRHESSQTPYARGAEDGGVWGGGIPIHTVSPTGRGLGKGLCPYPETFSILSSKRQVLVHSGTDKTYF